MRRLICWTPQSRVGAPPAYRTCGIPPGPVAQLDTVARRFAALGGFKAPVTHPGVRCDPDQNAPAKLAVRRSLHPGVFPLGLLEDRDVGVGVFPDVEEILVGSLCLGLVSRQNEGSAKLQMRHCAYGIADNDPAVIENLLKFRGGFGALVRGQIGLTTHIDRIEGPEVTMYGAARHAQVIGNGALQQVNRLGRLTFVQGQTSAKRREVAEPDSG